MSSENLLKVGVIGTGALGRHHARLYAQSPNAEMVGVFDVQKSSAEKVGAEFGLNVYDSWQALAQDCDALSVAVPATLHAQTVIPLLEMGKHVLVEKPIASSVEDAVKMVEAARKNQVVLAVGHVERFNPATDFLMQQSGNIRYLEARRLAAYPPSRPGLPPRGTEVSVILDLMVHDLDLVLALIDSEVVQLDVNGSAPLSPQEDIATARISFADGRCASVTASRLAHSPLRQLQVFQEDRYFELNYGAPQGVEVSRAESSVAVKNLEFPAKNALADELEDFISAVERTRESGKVCEAKVSGEHGLKVLRLAVDIENASRNYNAKFNWK